MDGSNSYELENLEAGTNRNRSPAKGHHSSSESSNSDSSNMLEYINNFAYNNAGGNLLQNNRSRSGSSNSRQQQQQQEEQQQPFLGDHEGSDLKFENYPRPITKKNVYSITFAIIVVWLIGLGIYSRHPRPSKIENSYKDYNVTAAFGLNTTDSAIMNSLPVPEVSSAVSSAIAQPSSTTPSSSSSSSSDQKQKRVDLDAYRSGKFFVYDLGYPFIEPPSNHKSTDDEGLYHATGSSHYFVKKFADKSFQQKLMPRAFSYQSKKYTIDQIVPNYDLTKVIVRTEKEGQWRHSSFAKFFVYDVKSDKFEPLYSNPSSDAKDDDLPKLSLAQWSPKYNFISFVYQNNFFVKDVSNGKTTQVTNDGGQNIFNGKPDWVYEEEVSATDRLLWWSPNEKNVVFIKTNDTDVPIYEIDYYTKNTNDKYPTHRPIKYPKPGYANPVLSIVNYNIDSGKLQTLDHTDADGSKLGHDFIVYDLFWLNDNDFLVKETDRESNVLHYRLYEHNLETSKVVRVVDAVKEFGGWIDKSKVIVIPKDSKHKREKDGYVDIFVDGNGYEHLAYFEADSDKPVKVLTEGNFDDKSDHLFFDNDMDLVYFTSTKQSSMSSHLYSVKLDLSSTKAVPELNALTKDDELGYYEPSFSPSARFVILNYKGPRLPGQKIIDLHSSDNAEFFTNIESITDTQSVEEAHKEYAVPVKQFTEIEVDAKKKVSVNVIETKPQNFDPKKKYPLLVTFYGGPGSQKVHAKYDVGFSEVVASSLDAVVLMIDPRGTNSKGWWFKSWARNKIGHWEPRDIIAATEKYIKDNQYIDEEKTVAWGWSYSGFVTLKLLEVDSEQVFKYGAAVAPVTDWRLYDSIYTERYINSPEHNEGGYEEATVGTSDIDNFKAKKRFLIMHGTGDDNVHIQNTYTLLDKFNLAGVENFDMKLFPDSDHSIYYHNANTIVYDKLFKWIKDAFNGSLAKLSN